MTSKMEAAAAGTAAASETDFQSRNEFRNISKAATVQADLPLTIAIWQKNKRERILVQLTEYEGRPLVAARVWFLDDDGELRPGKSGLAVAIRHLPRLAAAYADALAEARARGLLQDDDGGAA